MGGGTEAFPDLGSHCEHPDCRQLDFLPFVCDGCRSVFCLEHRSCKSHDCPKSDINSRKVIVCEDCSMSIETTGRDCKDEISILEVHRTSKQCDPSKKKKPRCPVPRCKEALTFSNTAVCKTCDVKVCLKHRFPIDHSCRKLAASSVRPETGGRVGKFLAALASRMEKDCAKTSNSKGKSGSPPATPRSIRAY